MQRRRGSDLSGYALWIGSAAAGNDIFNEHVPSTQTSDTVPTLPNNGSTVYVRLWSNLKGFRQFNDYSYTTCTAGANGCLPPDTKATMQSPAPGTTLVSKPTFTWNAATPASDLSGYALWIGFTPAGNDMFIDDVSSTQISDTVSTLPNNGSTIYVQLWSNLRSTWVFNDYTYVSSGGQ